MRAVVLEIKENQAAVLVEDGTIQKVADQGYSIGQEIPFDPEESSLKVIRGGRRRRSSVLRRVAAAACVVIVAAGGGLFYASENVFAYSTVQIGNGDENIELTLNKKDQVIDVELPENIDQDTAERLREIARKHEPLEDVAEVIADRAEEAPAIQTESKDEEREGRITEELRKAFPEKKDTETKKSDDVESGGVSEKAQDPAETKNGGEPGASQKTADSENGGEPGKTQMPAEEAVPAAQGGSGEGTGGNLRQSPTAAEIGGSQTPEQGPAAAGSGGNQDPGQNSTSAGSGGDREPAQDFEPSGSDGSREPAQNTNGTGSDKGSGSAQGSARPESGGAPGAAQGGAGPDNGGGTDRGEGRP